MMRLVVSTAVLLFSAVAIARAQGKKADLLPKEARKELENLQGQWALKQFEVSAGKSTPDPAITLRPTS